MLSGHAQTSETRRRHPESMPVGVRTACFRGDTARAMSVWAIRESMALSKPQSCGEQRGLTSCHLIHLRCPTDAATSASKTRRTVLSGADIIRASIYDDLPEPDLAVGGLPNGRAYRGLKELRRIHGNGTSETIRSAGCATALASILGRARLLSQPAGPQARAVLHCDPPAQRNGRPPSRSRAQ